MSQLNKLFALGFLFALPAHAATSTGVTASAVVVNEQLHIGNRTALDFGILLPGAQGGEVIVTPRFKRQVQGNIRMLPGLFAPAIFFINGTPNRFYTVNTPGTLVFNAEPAHLPSLGNGPAALTVKDFTTFSAALQGGDHRGYLGFLGKDALFVGGTLVVPANARAGHYHGLVPITVGYQ